MLVRTTVRGYIGCARAVRDADLRAADAQIRCPALVVSGADDASTPPSAGEALRDAIPGARYTLIPESAHIIAAEAPQALARTAFEFLSEHTHA
jgi:3-oxoadipate enol-lactonase